MASFSSRAVRSRRWRRFVRSSVARNGSSGGSRTTLGRGTWYTAVRGITTSSVSVRSPVSFSFFNYGFHLSIFLSDVRENIYILIVYHSGKDTPTHRLTHILRPNATRPDTAARAALATPPTTDGDIASQSPYDSDMPSSLSDIQSIDGGSDILSEPDFVPDLEPGREHRHHGGRHRLSHLGGETAPLSDIASDVDADVETGSVQGGDGGGGSGGSDLEQATAALSLANEAEAPRLPLRGAAYRTRTTVWDTRQGARSGSSPSRSPARRQPRRRFGRAAAKKFGSGDPGRRESFYDFIFK